MKIFKERFQDLLNEMGLNRLQLSKKLNISSSTINGYFGNYLPQIEIAVKIANFFNCSLDYLLGIGEGYAKTHSFNYDEIINNFIKNFDRKLEENNLSIAKALKELKMSETNYYRWRAGKFPKTVNLIAIAKFFNASIDEMLGE